MAKFHTDRTNTVYVLYICILPLHVSPLSAVVYPTRQEQENVASALVQVWAQLSVPALHSSMSVKVPLNKCTDYRCIS